MSLTEMDTDTSSFSSVQTQAREQLYPVLQERDDSKHTGGADFKNKGKRKNLAVVVLPTLMHKVKRITLMK